MESYMHQKIMDKDQINLSILEYKQLGEDMSRARVYLTEAVNAFNCVEKRCRKIEKETGINMQFLKE